MLSFPSGSRRDREGKGTWPVLQGPGDTRVLDTGSECLDGLPVVSQCTREGSTGSPRMPQGKTPEVRRPAFTTRFDLGYHVPSSGLTLLILKSGTLDLIVAFELH